MESEMEARILVGTTSWTEKTLVNSGRFYPPKATSAEQRLRYYASQFPIVEVDSSYYGLPSERNARLWVERTPEGFVFNVKAFRLLTHHQTPVDALPRDIRESPGLPHRKAFYARDLPQEALDEVWQRFRSALRPLKEAGKLGVVLFQFPPWFVYRPSHLRYIGECAERLGDLRIAVEFRNRTWLEGRHRDETLAFERRHEVTHVVVDEPQGFAGSVPAVWTSTSPDISVVRLHGRNRETWQKKGLDTAAARFEYLYDLGELQELVPPIRELARSSRSVHVLFNNCYRDYAQQNAIQLRGLLGQQGGVEGHQR